MNEISHPFRYKNVTAWILLVSAIGLHVIDETVTNFLDFYNPLVIRLKENLGFFPMPKFSFGVWLTGLISGIAIGYALTPVVNRGGRLIRVITTIIGVFMMANGLGHMLGSIYYGRLLPGFWSSPLLLAAAMYMAVRGFRGEWPRQVT
jgi:hypothetical protein